MKGNVREEMCERAGSRQLESKVMRETNRLHSSYRTLVLNCSDTSIWSIPKHHQKMSGSMWRSRNVCTTSFT